MDAIDLKILSVMQTYPDLSIADVSERVGLSHTPCWRRVRKLEESGVILGKAMLLNADKLGLSVNVFAALKLKQHDEDTLEQFETSVRRHEEIVECFSVSGESDFIMRIVVPNIGAYERFLKKALLHLPGIGSINSNFTLRAVKLTTELPISSASPSK